MLMLVSVCSGNKYLCTRFVSIALCTKYVAFSGMESGSIFVSFVDLNCFFLYSNLNKFSISFIMVPLLNYLLSASYQFYFVLFNEI